MDYISVFKMPQPVSVKGRTSSITNSFVSGIIPCIHPSKSEVKECLQILGLDCHDLRCSYCGDRATEWDHFRPLIKNKKPTGYISDIYNLVPACGKCNQSKGNKNWREWISSQANLSPKSRKIDELEAKIVRLEKFEKWKEVKPINLSDFIDEDLWEAHWKNIEELYKVMESSQEISSKIQKQVKERYDLLYHAKQ